MSLRLRLLNRVLRLVARPILAHTPDVAVARRDFDLLARIFRRPPFVLHLIDHAVVPLHWISVQRKRTDWVILYFHGGAYCTGNPRTHLALAARIAKLTGLQVALPEYRLAPEDPAPAAFDDARQVHAALIAKGFAADQIILAGDSAGGGLALALLAHLCAHGLTPAGLFAFSPWTDLALTGASLVENAGKDQVLPASKLPTTVDLVLGELECRDPRISPLYARFERPPPVFIQVGSGEILLDDSRRMGTVLQRAGGQVEVTEWPDCPHVWQMLDGYLPEARLALMDVAGFVGCLIRSSQPLPGGS